MHIICDNYIKGGQLLRNILTYISTVASRRRGHELESHLHHVCVVSSGYFGFFPKSKDLNALTGIPELCECVRWVMCPVMAEVVAPEFL